MVLREGKRWFADRGMEMQAPKDKDSKIVLAELVLAEFCSKIYAGVGLPSWKKLLAASDPEESHRMLR
jgi:hypothetical protein